MLCHYSVSPSNYSRVACVLSTTVFLFVCHLWGKQHLPPSSQSTNRLLQVVRFQRLETGPSAHSNLSTCTMQAQRLFCFNTWFIISLLFSRHLKLCSCCLYFMMTSETVRESLIYLSGLWRFNCFYSHDAFNRRGSRSNTDVGSWSRRTITRW